MKRVLAFLALLIPLSGLAQGPSNPSVIPVQTAPLVCAGPLPLFTQYSTGDVWSCNNGTPNLLSNASGGDSITSPNSTITVGGTATATTLDIALGHANTWTANQTSAKWIASTGFDISGATTAGHYLRNNGTDFVDSLIQAGDLPTGIPIANVGSAGLSGTAPITISSGGAIGCSTCLTSSGISGMTASQVAIAATATTITSSKALAGSGSGITTGPTTSTNGDCVEFTGTAGQIADNGSACGSGGGISFPQTVAGTTTSGGVPYFSNTTTLTSSALLATNALVVGGGAGGAPATGNGDFTYATHTLTSGASGITDLSASTGTAAFKVPVHSSNTATAAGVIDFDSTATHYHVYDSGADDVLCTHNNGECTGSGTMSDGSGTTTAGYFADTTTSAHVYAVDTNLDDGHTAANTLTYAGAGGVSAPKLTASNPSGGVGSQVFLTQEGTVPSGLATSGEDNVYADSTQHGLLSSFNGGSTLPLVQGPASNTTLDLAEFSGTNGGKIIDTSILTANVTQTTSTPAANQACIFAGTSKVCTPEIVPTAAGGTGAGALTGIRQANGASADTVATGHQVQAPLYCPDTSGSGTAQSCSTGGTTYTPAAGDYIVYTTTTTNSGTGLTVNVNSLGAKSIAIPGASGYTTTLTASIIPANKPQLLMYDGTNWDDQQTGTAAGGGGSGTVSSGTANQVTIYGASGTTVEGSSALNVTGTATTSNVGIGQISTTNPIQQLEVGGPVQQDVPYTGTVTFSASCSATATSCSITGGANLNATGGVIEAGYTDGGAQEYICYSAATSTTLTIGGGNCQTPVTTNGRSYWGSTATAFANGNQIAQVLDATVASDTATPTKIVLGNGGVGSVCLGSCSATTWSQKGGIQFGTTVYATSSTAIGLSSSGSNALLLDSGGGTALVYVNASNNASLVTAPSSLDYSIATQTIATTATLTALTNVKTPVMPNNNSAAAAGTGGVLLSRCHVIWSQATGGTISFAVNLSAAVTRLDVTEADYDGAAGIVGSSFVQQNVTASGTGTAIGTVTPTTFATVYFSDFTLTLNPNTSNSASVQLYAESSSSSDTLSVYAGSGCGAWQ